MIKTFEQRTGNTMQKLRYMKVAIYSRVVEFDQYQELQHLFNELIRHKSQLCVFKPFFDQILSKVNVPGDISTFGESGDLDESIDFLISLGGDGTLLDTVTLVRDKNIPVLGINFGRLGFLASIGKGELQNA